MGLPAGQGPPGQSGRTVGGPRSRVLNQTTDVLLQKTPRFFYQTARVLHQSNSFLDRGTETLLPDTGTASQHLGRKLSCVTSRITAADRTDALPENAARIEIRSSNEVGHPRRSHAGGTGEVRHRLTHIQFIPVIPKRYPNIQSRRVGVLERIVQAVGIEVEALRLREIR